MTFVLRKWAVSRRASVFWWVLIAGSSLPWPEGRANGAPAVASLQALRSEIGEDRPAAEGFVILRAGATPEPLTVYYSINGTARNGQDYRRLPGSVTIPAGASSAVIALEPIEDTEVEGPEVVTLTVVSNTHPFTLAILPDTQYYIGAEYGGTPLMFDRQTQWIVDHKDDQHIAFVLHEGDITEDNDLAEWPLAKSILSRLDGVVPYALCLGNHDGMLGPVGQTELFNQYFPVGDYQSLATFGGVFETNRLDNSYHLFTAGGVDWMVVSLEYGPRDAALAWANQVVTNHPQRRVIVLTHGYLYYDNTLLGTVPTQRWLPTNDGRPNNGTDVWNMFVRHHANICLVFCGHVKGDGTGRLVSTGDHGNRVYQMVACYQGYPYGGSGWMRLVDFDPDQDRLSVRTYSPYLRLSRTDPENEFTYHQVGLFSPTNLTYTIEPSRSCATVIVVDNDTDVTPPAIVSVTALGSPSEIRVLFSEPLEQASAETIENYSLSGGIGLARATLGADLKSVVLTTAAPLTCGGRYTLTINHLADRAAPANTMVTDGQATFYHARLLLADSFDEEEMRLWTVVDEGRVEAPSLWSVAEGKMRQLSNLHGPSSNAVTNRQGTYVFWNSPAAFTWRNYGLSVTLNTLDDDGVGVRFRYQNRSNYCKVELDRTQNSRRLTKVVGGVETVMAQAPAGYPMNQDMHLHVQAETNRILVTLDGTVLFGGPIMDGALGAGTVALYCWGSEGVSFDDVRVASLDPPPCLVLADPVVDRSGRCQFTIIGPPASRYRIEASTDLAHWTTLTNFSWFPGMLRFTDPSASPAQAGQFFRVLIP